MQSYAGLRKTAVAVFLALGTAASGYGQEASVEVDTVRARVRPNLEIELPSGIVEQSSTLPIGAASFSVNSSIDFITGSIAGDVSLRRYFSSLKLTPFFDVGVEASTEPTLIPEETDSVDRARHATLGTYWSGWYGTFQLSTELREDLSFSENGDTAQSVDVIPTLGWEITDLRPVLPSQTPETVGGWFRIEVNQRTELGSQSAVDLRGRIAGLLHHRAFDRLRWRHRMEIYSPLVVWNRDRSETVGLGGFDSIRGFEDGAISTRRGIFSANTLLFNLGADDEMGDRIDYVRFHSLRALGVADIGLYQQDYSLTSAPQVMAGTGTGVATTLSAPGGIHLDLEFYVTLPVEASPMPVFYLRSSLFSLSTDLDELE